MSVRDYDCLFKCRKTHFLRFVFKYKMSHPQTGLSLKRLFNLFPTRLYVICTSRTKIFGLEFVQNFMWLYFKHKIDTRQSKKYCWLNITRWINYTSGVSINLPEIINFNITIFVQCHNKWYLLTNILKEHTK